MFTRMRLRFKYLPPAELDFFQELLTRDGWWLGFWTELDPEDHDERYGETGETMKIQISSISIHRRKQQMIIDARVVGIPPYGIFPGQYNFVFDNLGWGQIPGLMEVLAKKAA